MTLTEIANAQTVFARAFAQAKDLEGTDMEMAVVVHKVAATRAQDLANDYATWLAAL